MKYFRSIPTLKAKYEWQGQRVPSGKEIQADGDVEDEWYEKKKFVEYLYRESDIIRSNEYEWYENKFLELEHLYRDYRARRITMNDLDNALKDALPSEEEFRKVMDVGRKNDIHTMLKDAITKGNVRIHRFLRDSGWIETKSEGDIEYYRWTPMGLKSWKNMRHKRMELIKSSRSSAESKIKHDDLVPQSPSGMVLNRGQSIIDHPTENNHTVENYVDILINNVSDWD